MASVSMMIVTVAIIGGMQCSAATTKKENLISESLSQVGEPKDQNEHDEILITAEQVFLPLFATRKLASRRQEVHIRQEAQRRQDARRRKHKVKRPQKKKYFVYNRYHQQPWYYQRYPSYYYYRYN